jgi:hypothetical protein
MSPLGAARASLGPPTLFVLRSAAGRRRSTDDKFSSQFISTVGVDFKSKVLALSGERVKLQVRGARARCARCARALVLGARSRQPPSFPLAHARARCAGLGHSGAGALSHHLAVISARRAGHCAVL